VLSSRRLLDLSIGIALAAMIVLGTGCSRSDRLETPKADPRPRNVVIVLVDALRADALGCYGAAGDPTPSIDRIAEHALLFENAYANATFTFPSTASMFTSTLPVVHRITWDEKHQELIRRLSDQYLLLTEVFKRAGYRTGLLTFPAWVSPTANYMQGVDVWVEGERTDHDLLARARSFVSESRPGPFFLYVHLIEMHDYFFPQHLFEGVDPEELGLSPGLMRLRDMTISEAYDAFAYQLNAPGALTGRDLAFLRSRYVERLRDTDRAIGEFARFLKEEGLAEDTVLAITADHGEQFLEHGRLVHGADGFYNDVLHIPFIAANPLRYASRVAITTAVSSIDFGPILLDVVGLEVPPVFQGESVLGRLDDPSRVVFATDRRTWKAISRDWSYIVSEAKNREELYHLADDPGETTNLVAERPDMVAVGRRQVAAMREACQQHPYMRLSVEERTMSEEELERLRSLGYVR
jgi:membrane-anchored protein YejM (alkaline phosphatase superfamily)